jgi:hypothetical protein
MRSGLRMPYGLAPLSAPSLQSSQVSRRSPC